MIGDETAFELGWVARYEDRERSSNPYQDPTLKQLWNDGWDEADAIESPNE